MLGPLGGGLNTGSSGGGVLGVISYSAGINGPWSSTNSGALTDIDAVNAALLVSVPASGKILVMIQGEFWVTVAHSNCVLGIRTGTTTLIRRLIPTAPGGAYGPPSLGANDTHTQPEFFYITGLTPGLLTIKAAFAVDSGGGTLNVAANNGAVGHDSPFIMSAWAA